MFSAIIAICLFLLLVFKCINIPKSPAILGIYQQANELYYLKFIFLYVTLLFRQLLHRGQWRLAVELGESGDGTIHVHNIDTYLEKPRDLGRFSKSLDTISFNGTAKNNSVLVCGVSRRPAGACNGFIYLKIGDGELLMNPELPSTLLKQTEEEAGKYKVAGIHIAMVIPMRSWKLQYSGEMKARSDPSKLVRVKLDLTWSTKWHRFHYNSDMSVAGLARDLAREPWSTEYFQLLESLYLMHYEQIGLVNGTALIDGESHSLSMECVRTRTFGQNVDLRNIHRAIFHFIYLENGNRISLLSISHPATYSQLSTGFLCLQSTHCEHAVSSCGLELYQHGERHTPPTDYAFDFTAGGEKYLVEVSVRDEASRYDGERELRVLERWAEFRVDGVRGWGCTEWLYRHVDGNVAA